MAKPPPAFMKKTATVSGPKGKLTVSKKVPPPMAAPAPAPMPPAFKKGGKVKK